MFPRFNPTGACSPLSRRQLLSAGGLGMFGLTMPRHSETMVKDVIGRDVPISYGKVIHDIIA